VEKHGEHKDRRGKQKKSSAYAPARSLRFVNSVPSVLFALRLARNRQNPGSEKHGEHKDHRGKQKKSSASAPARSLRFVNSVPSVFVRASAGSVTIRTPVGKTRRTQRQQRKTKEIVSLRSGPFPSLCELRALCVCSGFGWQRNHQNSGRTNTENTKTAEEKQKKSSAFAPARSLRFVNSVPSVFVRASAGSVTIRTPVGQTRKTQRPQRKNKRNRQPSLRPVPFAS
jgi:hypothetical protein